MECPVPFAFPRKPLTTSKSLYVRPHLLALCTIGFAMLIFLIDHVLFDETATRVQDIASFTVSMENELPPLLERRLQSFLADMASSPEVVLHLQTLISKLKVHIRSCVNEVASNFRTVNLSSSLHYLPCMPSRESCGDSGADSGYYSTRPRCGRCNIEGCLDCILSSSPFSCPPSAGFQCDTSPSPVSPGGNTIDPSRIASLSSNSTALDYGFPDPCA